MTKNKGKRPSQVTVDDFRADPMFPKIERVVANLLVKGNVVTPIDVLVGMGLLKPEHLNDWRFGRTPCLEGIVEANDAPLEVAAHPRLLRARLEPQAVLDCLHALRQGPGAAAAFQHEWRSRARKGLRDAFHLVGQGALPCAPHHDDSTRVGSLRTPITNWARMANLNPVDSALLSLEAETNSCGSRGRFGHLARPRRLAVRPRPRCEAIIR